MAEHCLKSFNVLYRMWNVAFNTQWTTELTLWQADGGKTTKWASAATMVAHSTCLGRGGAEGQCRSGAVGPPSQRTLDQGAGGYCNHREAPLRASRRASLTLAIAAAALQRLYSLLCSETGSHYVAVAGLECTLEICLPLLSKCWD